MITQEVYMKIKRIRILPGWFPFNRLYYVFTMEDGTWADAYDLIKQADEMGFLLEAKILYVETEG